MGKKTPPFVNYPAWTTSRFFTFLRSALRQAWNRYPPKYEALRRAETGRKTNPATGKLAKHYLCAECKREFVAKEVQVDHKIDAGTLKSFEDVELFVRNLFCSVEDLAVLCKQCHHNKTHKK
jgi:5-methylcytosine-specific restriction endonuclease McrA